MAGEPPSPCPAVNGATDGRSLKLDPGACSARETILPPRGHRLQKTIVAEGTKVNGPAVLPAAHGSRGDRVLPPRQDDRPPEARDGRVLVVQLWEEAVTAPPVYGMQSMGSPNQGTLETDRGRIVGGSTRGHRPYGGYGSGTPRGRYWNFWKAREWGAGRRRSGQGQEPMREGTRASFGAPTARREGQARPESALSFFLFSLLLRYSFTFVRRVWEQEKGAPRYNSQ